MKKVCIKILMVFLFILMMIASLSSCKHECVWLSATCEDPKICSDYLETDGVPLGHIWLPASCIMPQTCSVCRVTEGDALGHSWVDATCVTPKTCDVCQLAEGEVTEHIWTDATCISARVCSFCLQEEGKPLGHEYFDSIEIEADCGVQGVKKYLCKNCNDSYNENYDYYVYSASELYDKFISSVGEIITYDTQGKELSIGSCFVYSDDGKIITNYHVIEDSYSANIVINNHTYPVAYVLAYNKTIDIAILKIEATGLTNAKICKNAHKVGEAVYAIGSSKGLTATFSDGIISYSSRELDGVTYVQHDAPISSGNSGGPLINKYGEIIGVNTWTVRDSQNLNFAISVTELDKLKYDTPLTMAEYYDKECNTYLKLKNYIIEKGTYNKSENYYFLKYENYIDGIQYTRRITYLADTDCFGFALLLNNGKYAVTMLIDNKISGIYEWYYIDNSSNMMYGDIYANTYTSTSLLGYTYNNLKYASMRSVVRELASEMINLLCENMDSDLSIGNVTAEDLGFLYY